MYLEIVFYDSELMEWGSSEDVRIPFPVVRLEAGSSENGESRLDFDFFKFGWKIEQFSPIDPTVNHRFVVSIHFEK